VAENYFSPTFHLLTGDICVCVCGHCSNRTGVCHQLDSTIVPETTAADLALPSLGINISSTKPTTDGTRVPATRSYIGFL
jgi:hypothetical protein